LRSKRRKKKTSKDDIYGLIAFLINAIVILSVLLRLVDKLVNNIENNMMKEGVAHLCGLAVGLLVYNFVILVLYLRIKNRKKIQIPNRFITTNSVDRLLWSSGYAFATVSIGQELIMTRVNKNVYKLFGCSYKSYAILNLKDLVNEEDYDNLQRMIRTALKNNMDTISTVIRTKGTIKLEKTLKVSCNIAGDKMAIIFTDITEELLQSKKLEIEHNRYKMLSEICGYTVFELTEDGNIVYKTANFDRLFGDTPIGSNLIKKVLKDNVLSAEELRKILTHKSDLMTGNVKSFEMEIDVVDSTGTNHYYRLIVSAIQGLTIAGEELRLLCTATNIDQEVTTRDKLEDMASLDSLTGLLNKTSFRKEVDSTIEKAEITSGYMVMFDIDDFKGLNDKLGHSVGDKAIIDVADIIRKSIRKQDLAGRFGGDEYCIFLVDANREQAEEILEDIRKSVVKQYESCKCNDCVELTISLGAVAYPENGNTASLLMNNADIALYDAKQTGKNKLVIY